MDGALVKQGFLKLENDIDLLKKQSREASAGESLTELMIAKLELMRQHVVAREHSISMISGGASHVQMLVDNLGSATSVQDGRVAGLGHHTAQLQFFIEALRAGQEEQQCRAAPTTAARHRRRLTNTEVVEELDAPEEDFQLDAAWDYVELSGLRRIRRLRSGPPSAAANKSSSFFWTWQPSRPGLAPLPGTGGPVPGGVR